MASRSRAAPRRPPRAAPRPGAPPGAARRRPLLAAVAAVFGALVAVDDLYLAWLLRTPGTALAWYVVVPLVFAALALAGSVLVVLGRARGWLLLAVAAVVPLLGLLGLVALFGYLGGGTALWAAVLMLVAPIGCLALVLRRPVREWTSPARATRRSGRGSRAARAR